jgi:hypothetical protein
LVWLDAAFARRSGLSKTNTSCRGRFAPEVSAGELVSRPEPGVRERFPLRVLEEFEAS